MVTCSDKTNLLDFLWGKISSVNLSCCNKAQVGTDKKFYVFVILKNGSDSRPLFFARGLSYVVLVCQRDRSNGEHICRLHWHKRPPLTRCGLATRGLLVC